MTENTVSEKINPAGENHQVDTLKWFPVEENQGYLTLIDQTLLPHKFEMVECRTYQEVGEAIKAMKIRGAPAIGVAASYGMALAAFQSLSNRPEQLLAELKTAHDFLHATRPTAVNLAWALSRSYTSAGKWFAEGNSPTQIGPKLLELALQMHEEDVAVNRAMGAFGATLISSGDNILTHCNAGALATAGFGTALGVIRSAHEAGKTLHVWVDETRPYLQGARLTAWELQQLGIPMTLITDSMAGHLMQRGRVQMVITGADRIAANGDSSNKIGTYSLAVLAKEHNLPFYIAAPLSTIDRSISDGWAIPIEERSTDEVVFIAGNRIAPIGVNAAHFGFDVTPARYIHGIITERGIARPPFNESIKALFNSAKED